MEAGWEAEEGAAGATGRPPPGADETRRGRDLAERLARPPDESNPLGVGRPGRARIAVHGRRHVDDLAGGGLVDADEAMVLAVADKGDLPAVGRPDLAGVGPPGPEERLRAGLLDGGRRRSNRRDKRSVDLAILDIKRHSSARREDGVGSCRQPEGTASEIRTAQMACSLPSGACEGLATQPSRLGSWPRTKTATVPSSESASPVRSVPSSAMKRVRATGLKSGAAAVKTLRRPFSNWSQATRSAFLAATSS